jgi:hypothetical protein
MTVESKKSKPVLAPSGNERADEHDSGPVTKRSLFQRDQIIYEFSSFLPDNGNSHTFLKTPF